MLSLLASVAFATERTQTEETYWKLWTDYHASGKRYLPDILTADEHSNRFEVFKDNVDTITRHNEKKLSWTYGVSPFADMTGDEFKTKVLNPMCADKMQTRAKLNQAKTKLYNGRRRKVETANPSSVDWVTAGKITPIKNQGQCGSCWAFSTTGSIEGRTAIHNNADPVSLSEQELVDCDDNDNGCNGGAMQNGFMYAEAHGGLCLESDYSYTAADGTCKSSTCTHHSPVSTYTTVSYGESFLETAVASGPVSVAIEADQETFQFYESGVFSGECGTGLDHGVLIVGYGTDDGAAYWKMKNSWGTTWGESGYMRMCKDCDKNDGAGQCGLAEDASFPVIA